jgi:glutamyl-tRNA(Gln) amidotransferase subunit D
MAQEKSAAEGDRVRITLNGGTVYEGRLMPTHAFSQAGTSVVKLDNGYNIGLRLDEHEGHRLEVLEKARPPAKAPRASTKQAEGRPKVVMLGTGGTIASYVDYRTGAVWPATEPEDLAALVPEIFDAADVETKIVFKMFSEDMQPEHWRRLAEECAAAFEQGAKGIVIPHGTDTMGYTATALAFMMQNLPGPVVLVGAQRSSDRPSSDARENLMAAVRVAAEAEAGEVLVVMHEHPDDTRLAIHRGVRVRKMHTSRRDAFRSINARPVGYVDKKKGITLEAPMRPPSPLEKNGKVPIQTEMDEDVAMIQSYPGLSPEHILDVVRNGVILVGTGLGHVARRCLDAVKQCVDRGAVVVMTSQCIYGRVDMHVYATGRDLLNAGVIEAGDMSAEVAYIKLMWALGQTKDRKEVQRIMTSDLVGELSLRTEVGSYLN